MKFFRFAALLLACVLPFAACTKSGGGAAPGAGGHNPWTQPGVLRLGEPDEPDSINPMFGHSYATDEAATMIFSYLMRYDDNGNFVPDLALQVPSYANGGVSKDGKTITFHLRKAQWADGAPLTAKDWMFTYNAVRNPANNTKSLFGWDDIASAQAPDDETIVVHLKQANSTILGIFAMGGNAYPPLPAHILAKYPDINRVPFNSTPLSSGPYILKQWNHGASLIFVPNPYYWRGAPKIKEVVWKVIPNVSTLFNELQTHEIDVYSDVDQLHIANLSSLRGYRISHRLIANWRHMGINMSRPFLRDVRVRTAIAEGVDWKRINDTIYHGYNQLAVSDIFPQSWAAPNIPPYPYNPDQSKQLLAQAGWTMGSDGWLHNKSGQILHLSISTNTDNQPNNQAEVQIQSQLRALGIQIEIRNYPTSLLFAQDGPLYQGHFDLEWSVETNAPDPDNSGLWNSKYIPPHGGNTSWLRDPIVDQTSDAALLTFDQTKRKALYQREEEEIHKVVPAVFFYWENSFAAINTDVKGYVPGAYISDMWNCWQWQVQ
jgi:peptide/nickel transport system substrate-binding protein